MCICNWYNSAYQKQNINQKNLVQIIVQVNILEKQVLDRSVQSILAGFQKAHASLCTIRAKCHSIIFFVPFTF